MTPSSEIAGGSPENRGRANPPLEPHLERLNFQLCCLLLPHDSPMNRISRGITGSIVPRLQDGPSTSIREAVCRPTATFVTPRQMSFIKVDGTSIVDASGKKVVLHGAGLGGWMTLVLLVPVAAVLLTDGLQDGEFHFGCVLNGISGTLSSLDLSLTSRIPWVRVPNSRSPSRYHWKGEGRILLRQGSYQFPFLKVSLL